MKIVIDISDNKYKWIVENPQTYTGKLHNAIRNGTPLPEHHGDLIDRSKLDFDHKYEQFESDNDYDFVCGTVWDAPTIIEGSDEE